MFTETVGADTVESRAFPRTNAVGERLWTSPEASQGHTWVEAELRYVQQRERIVERGIRSEAVNMHWCHQFEDQCRLK